MDQETLNELNGLILETVKIGNQLEGKKITTENHFKYGEGIGKKILNHVFTVRKVAEGYTLSFPNNKKTLPIFDFSSVAVITRSAFESYLVFHHIFINSKDEQELEFRFKCWDYAGYLERSEIEPHDERSRKIHEYEKQKIEELGIWISKHEFYLRLGEKNREKLLNGKWHFNKTWKDIAKSAGFNQKFFSERYSFLSGYSHSSRLSIIQIIDGQELQVQKDMMSGFVQILMMVLAKFTIDYVHGIPELSHIIDELDKYPVTNRWKTIAESM